jgi:hypothetical protein
MDPHARSCHNAGRPARGKVGFGHIRTHSRAELRYRCTTCGRTLALPPDTPFYHLKKATNAVMIAVALPCPGCPSQAFVADFCLDERTVAAWRGRAR